ncbi:MAG: acetylxylan esterase [Sodaliphilus sp.]
MMMRFRFLFLSLLCFAFAAVAQSSKPDIKVVVTPVATQNLTLGLPIPDSLHFAIGTPVHFTITATLNGESITPSSVRYSFNEDKMTPTPLKALPIHNGAATTPSSTMRKSGFLRCNAEVVYKGKTYKGHSMVGFDVKDLKPTVQMPADFSTWWAKQIDAAAKIPMNPEMQLLPDLCTDTIDVYEVSIQAVEPGFRVHGILAMPKAEGKYPVVMRVPGAGVHKIGGLLDEAKQGIITLDMGIHGLSLTRPDSYYANLTKGALKDYPFQGIESRHTYYYRRVYLSALRMIDYLSTLPQFDGVNLYVCGGSQGGALSIVCAAMSPKVTAIECFFPALADQEAYLHGRAGGWPHYFYAHRSDPNIRAVAREVAYFDVANFARLVTKPVFMSFGLADVTCAPTCTYSTWNVISAADKCLVVTPQIGHWRNLKVWAQGWQWMLNHKQ